MDTVSQDLHKYMDTVDAKYKQSWWFIAVPSYGELDVADKNIMWTSYTPGVSS